MTDLQLIRAWLRLGLDAHTRWSPYKNRTRLCEVIAPNGVIVGEVDRAEARALVDEFAATDGGLMALLRSYLAAVPP